MNYPTSSLQWRAAFAAAFLIALGACLGVTADRIWLAATNRPDDTQQVTIEALALALNLNARERDRVAALVDSIGWNISAALEENPDSLSSIVRNSRLRLEEALPSDRQQRFRSWAEDQRGVMLDRMRGGYRNRAGRGRHMMPDERSGRQRRGSGYRRQRPDRND